MRECRVQQFYLRELSKLLALSQRHTPEDTHSEGARLGKALGPFNGKQGGGRERHGVRCDAKRNESSRVMNGFESTRRTERADVLEYTIQHSAAAAVSAFALLQRRQSYLARGGTAVVAIEAQGCPWLLLCAALHPVLSGRVCLCCRFPPLI